MVIAVICIIMVVCNQLIVSRTFSKLEYNIFINMLNRYCSVDTWEKMLIEHNYSVEYTTENAVKFRDKYLKNRGLTLDDCNLTLRKFKKKFKKERNNITEFIGLKVTDF